MSTIQESREAQGESRQQLADALDVTLHEVTAWETGEAEPSVERFAALARHFGVGEHEIELVPPSGPGAAVHGAGCPLHCLSAREKRRR